MRLLLVTPWLDDEGFVDACVVIVDGDIAFVDWAAVGDVVTDLAESPDDEVVALRLAHTTARPSWDALGDDVGASAETARVGGGHGGLDS